MSAPAEASPAHRAGILPRPPFRMAADYFAKNRRNAWLGFLCAPWLFLFAYDSVVGERIRISVVSGVRGAVACTLLGSWALAAGWRGLRQLRLGQVVASKGEDVFCRVVSVEENKVSGVVTALVYRILVPPVFLRTERHVTARFPYELGSPLLAFDGTFVLALVVEDQPETALVLRQDLWPLTLTAEQLQDVCARLQRADPAGGWRLARSRTGQRLLREADAAARRERLHGNT